MEVKHHPQNRNLKLHYQPTYNGMPVNQFHGPLVEQYLEAIDNTFRSATTDHHRVIVVRMDLRLPASTSVHAMPPESSYMTRFFSSLKAKIEHKKRRTITSGKRWHDTTIRYTWCKEYSAEHRHHYHVAIFLNGDTFRGLGAFDLLVNSLYTMIVEAWASALRIADIHTVGLPNFSGQKTLHRGQPYHNEFFWLSYMAKAKTKSWTDGKHTFGCSRNNKTFPA